MAQASGGQPKGLGDPPLDDRWRAALGGIIYINIHT